MTSMVSVVEGCRKTFDAGTTRPISWRKTQLLNFLRLLDENASVFASALAKDLHKPEQEALSMELEYVRNDVRGVLNNFEDWVQDHHVEKNIVTMLDQTFLHYDPLGVVLIIGAWNYPLQLTLGPLAGAIAAGNCAVLKPSEISPATAAVISELLPKYLDPAAFKVVGGGIPETTELLKQRFDHIFFTGSAPVGKIVGEAANKHLTPTTLELGGKSPVYICESTDFETTAKRLIWAKMINLGQTCIAPDYVLCTQQVQDKFIAHAKALLLKWYGQDSQKSPDICRIVNRRNFDRLHNIIQTSKGQIIGGRTDADDLFIEPTLVTGITQDDSTMQTELFGPILPFITVNNKEEAIEFIKSRDKPLTIYVFTNDKAVTSAFKSETSSGSMVINDAIVHLTVETLPFGGVGQSGMGSYHGKTTFTTFSHEKSVLVRDFSAFGEFLGRDRYPPYSTSKLNRLNFLLKNRKIPGFLSFQMLKYVTIFVLGASAATLAKFVARKYNIATPSWF